MVLTKEIEAYLKTLEIEFKNNANTEEAYKQKKYMRNKFAYYGLKTKERRAIQKPFFVKAFLPKKEMLGVIVKTLWQKEEREYQHFSQELAFAYVKELEKKDIQLLEYMVTHKSWWDTVDFIANKLIGEYFKMYPNQKMIYIEKWLKSGNIWLQRSALLFQLKYKKEVDTEILSYVINSLVGTKEFFINKAIGWVLREYSRTNKEWVLIFVEKTNLHPLSRREALRLVNKN